MKYFDYKRIKSKKSNCGLIKESSTENIGFARADMYKGLSGTHYHKKLTKYYLVLEGRGLLRIKTHGRIKEIELKPGIIVKIEPKEIHQTKTFKKLILETITRPAWAESDEYPVNMNLFKEKISK